MNPLLKAREVDYYLSDSQARIAFAWHGIADQATEGARRAGIRSRAGRAGGVRAGARPLRAPHPASPTACLTDTAVILYTSGTTGQPKGAELTHDNLLHNVEVTAATLLHLEPDDVVLGALPLFHSFGQVVGMGCSRRRGRVPDAA